MHKLKVLTLSIILVMVLSLAGPSFNVSARPLAATAPPLGAAESFSVLAALSMSAAGAGTTVQYDLGLSPGLAISRTGPWTVGGSQYFGPLSLAATAQTAALGAYNNLVGQASDGPWAASPWSPLPGVRTVASDTTFAGTITLNGGYDDVWVFQVGRDMTFTGSVIMAGNAQPCHVFWQIGRDATIAVGSTFVGTLIASRDVTLVSGATVNGRIISLNSSLTTDGNTITGPTCALAPTITTNLSSSSVTAGSAVYDSATLSGATSNAGGTVTYSVYTNSTCTLNVQNAGTKTVLNGVVPNSNSITFNSAGTYYWQAVYSGDTNNKPATSLCTSEELTVIKATPTLTTTASGPVTVGGIITDTAHLVGGFGTLTGTLTFDVFAPGDTTCETDIAVNPAVSVSGTGNYTSAAYATTAVGTYRWIAHYSGDANNNPVDTACNDAGETSTVLAPIVLPATTTITTALSASSITAGGTAYDTATLTGVNSSTATGSVIYSVYTNSTCTGTAQTTRTVVLTTLGVPNSPSITFPSAGTYYWQAAYSGDTNNAASTSLCLSEVLTVLAPVPVPVPTTIPGVLPSTGFAPNRMTVLPVQSADQAYTAMGDLWLEIPKLGVKMNIVGVPQSNGKWDVSWLGTQAGWLNGSAFPTWAGNSVLTGHVWNANNTAGPFRYINTLWWGDKVIVHAWGAQYVYQVRSVMQVGPGNTNAMLKHQELPWVTLITCRGFDLASDSYKYRVLVRAVLIEVK